MTLEMKTTEQSEIASKTRRWMPLIIFLALIAVFATSGAYKSISFEALVSNYSQLKTFVADNLLLGVLAYALIYIVAVALSFPAAWVLTIAGGIFFGWWIAGMVTVVSATIGASILFWIASTSFGAHLRDSAGPFVQKIRKGMQDDAVNYMLFLRLVPAFPFTLVNIVPAILGVPFSIFFWTTLVGIGPGTFAYSYAGEGLASIVEAQASTFAKCVAAGTAECGVSFSPSDLVTPELLIAFSALGLVSLLPIVIKRFVANNSAN